MKRIYICEFYQENNSFNPVLSGHNIYLCGDPVWQEDRQPQYIGDESLAVAGMIDALKEQGIIPVLASGAVPPAAGLRSGDRVRNWAAVPCWMPPRSSMRPRPARLPQTWSSFHIKNVPSRCFRLMM